MGARDRRRGAQQEAALARARDIMAADPSAATALSLVGQKVDMKMCFSLHAAKPGEDLFIIGSDGASATGTRTRAWP